MTAKEKTTTQAVSLLLSNGDIAESIRTVDGTVFLVQRTGRVEEQKEIEESGILFVPLSKDNKLLKHGVMVIAGGVSDYDSTDALIEDIRQYLHRYVDLTQDFEMIATYYVLLTWVYDAFNEVPYLRFQGEYGSGKSRALLVLGAICYKTVFASGASTISPIFHILDSYRGTLVFDETDFRYSDERADIVKILNNGNIKGFPVLRSMLSAKKEFEPQAFNVFGPKIVAMREAFEDDALESRFITERMGDRTLRADIPINLDDSYQKEAAALRNKLLMYRFQNRNSIEMQVWQEGSDISPRTQQIIRPLLAVITDEIHRARLIEVVSARNGALTPHRRQKIEAHVAEVLHETMRNSTFEAIPLSSIVHRLIEDYGDDIERPITSRFVGSVIRKLGIATYRTRGVFVIPVSEKEKVAAIARLYGTGMSDIA